jgi:type 1 fimbria pilin
LVVDLGLAGCYSRQATFSAKPPPPSNPCLTRTPLSTITPGPLTPGIVKGVATFTVSYQ